MVKELEICITVGRQTELHNPIVFGEQPKGLHARIIFCLHRCSFLLLRGHRNFSNLHLI